MDEVEFSSRKRELQTDRDEDLRDNLCLLNKGSITQAEKGKRDAAVISRYDSHVSELRDERRRRLSSGPVGPSVGSAGVGGILYVRARQGRDLGPRQPIEVNYGTTFSEILQRSVDIETWDSVKHLSSTITCFVDVNENEANSLRVRPCDSASSALLGGFRFVLIQWIDVKSPPANFRRSSLSDVLMASSRRNDFLPDAYEVEMHKTLHFPEQLFNFFIGVYSAHGLGVALEDATAVRSFTFALRDALMLIDDDSRFKIPGIFAQHGCLRGSDHKS